MLDLHLDRSCASPDAINSHRQERQDSKVFCIDSLIVLAAKMCFWFAEIEEVALAAELAMVALGKMSSGALPEVDSLLTIILYILHYTSYYAVLYHNILQYTRTYCNIPSI